MTLARLRRVQWILRAALAFALLISMATNVLHAEDDPIAQGVAAWSPLALFVAIEVMMRVPVRSMVRAGLRIVATASIAGIAAWTSYWHMVGVVARYEHGEVPYLLPLSVDGLILVLSVSLFDVASQIREHLDTAPPTAPAAETPPASLAVDTVAVPPSVPDIPALGAITSNALTPHEAAPADEPATTGPVDRHEAHDDDDEDQDEDHENQDNEDRDDEDQDQDDTEPDSHADLAPDLVPYLPAAQAARDELLEEGATVSRDALAQRLRRNGTALRNTRVSELLAALKAETRSVNGSRPKTSV